MGGVLATHPLHQLPTRESNDSVVPGGATYSPPIPVFIHQAFTGVPVAAR